MVSLTVWVRHLPDFARRKFAGRHGLRAVLGNSGWLFADKILRLVVGLLVGIWIVRYLGPVQFGVLNYAVAFAGLFAPLAGLGLDGIVVRELVKEPARRNELLGSAFALKLAAGALAFALPVLSISVLRGAESLTMSLVAIAAAGFLFQSLGVIDFYFQSEIRARNSVYASSASFLILTLTRVILLWAGAPLIAFAWAVFAELAATACFLVAVYTGVGNSVGAWRFDSRVARELLTQSWPLILSGIAIVIYMRIDQIMIGQMLGNREVGLFSAAVRVSEMWYFVPIAIASSVFPSLAKSRDRGQEIYLRRLQQLFIVVVWIGIGMAVFTTLARNFLVRVLFGAPYAASATTLAIHIWAGVFVALGVASSNWLILERLQKINFYRTLSGGLANVTLNFYLIPRHGIAGSAVATVTAQSLAALFFDAWSPRTRPIFWMKMRAFNPWELIRIAKA